MGCGARQLGQRRNRAGRVAGADEPPRRRGCPPARPSDARATRRRRRACFIHSSGASSAVMASPAAAASRTARSAGQRVPGLGGRMEASTACRTRPSAIAFVIGPATLADAVVTPVAPGIPPGTWPRPQASRPRQGSLSAMRPQRPATLATGNPSPPTALRSHDPSSPPASPPARAHRPWPRGRPAWMQADQPRDNIAARVLRLNGLTHRGQTTPKQLFSDRDLLGPQRGQHGIAVHSRRRL